tara:strand:+ start:33 stop:563 length:531 start_codon:yes stop_codon:yes gene_type:complete
MSNEKLTIIPSDKFIGVGSTGYVGIGSDSDWDWIADNIHAVQWNGTSGHVEYNDGTPEVGLTTIADYKRGYRKWEDERDRLATEELRLEKETRNNIDWMKALRHWRNIYLEDSDWIVSKSLEAGVPVPDDWKTYRQSLRDIPDGLDANTIESMVNGANTGIGHTGWPTAPGGWTFS